MARPPNADLLRAWERGQSAGPVARGLLLLAASHPNHAPASLASLPIGRRDGLLLDLREALFGSRLDAVIRCSDCRTAMEVECQVADLRAIPVEPSGSIRVSLGETELRVRLPDSLDLAHAAAAGSVAAGREVIFKRCVDAPPSDPSEELLATVAAALATADPQAATVLEVVCPTCGVEAAVPYDVVAFLWSELNGWVARLLGEIHTLALAYGWTEEAILALSATRRRAYLEMVSQ